MTYRIEIPRDESIDSSLALLTEGYKFIPNRCKKYQSNIFKTRIMGQKAICISGEEATKVFYDPEYFQRTGATPKRVQKTLFGENGVQSLDGMKHKHRKNLFMSLMTAERINELKDIAKQQWKIAARWWEEEQTTIVLFRETELILFKSACLWTGIPIKSSEINERTRDLAAMIDAFGAVGPRHWFGRVARLRSESWIKNIIQQVRDGKLVPAKDTPLHAIAWHREQNNKLINLQIASVELINVLRPIVAIGRFITFGALALYDYPHVKKKLQTADEKYSEFITQEVRRFYPFSPFLGANVKKDFFWGGHDFKKGTLVLLDVYGMNHNPEFWDEPNTFNPERFANWTGNPYSFIPQGGGEYTSGHRCPGERITIEMMKIGLSFLAKNIDYEVPKQNLSYSTVRMPSLIKSGFIISNVKRKQSETMTV